MNYSELIKRLKEANWYFERNGKGSHRIWRHPDRAEPLIIPDHGSKELNPGLVRGIMKQAKIR